MVILGISFLFDASTALLKDGELVAAAAEYTLKDPTSLRILPDRTDHHRGHHAF